MSSKKKALTLTIPEPCHENFNKMAPVKGGRFCGTCEKTIVDFRKMSDRQIYKFYNKNGGKICGVFNNIQLNRPLPFPMDINPSNNWKAIAALASGLLFSGGLAAQKTTPLPLVGKMAVVEQSIIKTDVAVEESTSVRVLRGLVIDKKQEILTEANITIKNSKIGTITDIDGNFELTIPTDLIEFEVVVSYIGYEPQILFFNNKNPIPVRKVTIKLTEGILLGDIEVTAEIVKPVTMIVGGIRAFTRQETKSLTEKNVPEAPEMKIYPNPFISDLSITYKYKTKGDYLFNLYDVNGRLLFAKSYNLRKGKQTIKLEVSAQNLMDGVYILQLSDSKNRILSTKKVFKGEA